MARAPRVRQVTIKGLLRQTQQECVRDAVRELARARALMRRGRWLGLASVAAGNAAAALAQAESMHNLAQKIE